MDVFQYLAEGSSLGFDEFSKRLAIAKTTINNQQIQNSANQLVQKAAQDKATAEQFKQKQQIEWFKTQNILNANINTLNTINSFKNGILDNNMAIYQQNADAVNRAAYIDQMKANKQAAQFSGAVRNSYAAAGIIVDTGSAESVRQQGVNEIFSKADEDYAAKHNSIRELLSKINQTEAQKYLNDLNTSNEIKSLTNNVNMVY